MNNFYNKLYLYTDKNTKEINNFLFKEKTISERIIGFLKTPYYLYILILEILLKRYLDKQIFESLLTDESVIENLDKNEFAYKKYSLIKKDILPEDNPLSHLNDLQLKNEIRNEFERFILEIIRSSNIVFNIENFLKVQSSIETDINSNRIFTVIICYYKNPYIVKLQNYILLNISILISVSILLVIIILDRFFGI